MLLFLALQRVYHVANPDVAGKVLYRSGDRWVGVMFETPVSFSSNPNRGYEKYWECSANLLHPTSAEAWKHKRY